MSAPKKAGLQAQIAEQGNSVRGAEWPVKTSITDHVELLCQQSLSAYKADPILIQEHSNLEKAVATGSYGHRQIYELIQNGADALLGTPSGRIHVLLTSSHLYCANEGHPISKDGVQAILHSHLSVKRGNEIGRFGIGFKSVLGVTDQPAFFSRSGSFAFSADRSSKAIREIQPTAQHCPVLRLGYPLDAVAEAKQDSVLGELMSWATTIVRLPRDPKKSSWLGDDIVKFPAEFLLFCPHVTELVLEDRTADLARTLSVRRDGDKVQLSDGTAERSWRVFTADYKPTLAARREAGELADRENLPLIWAVPTDGKSHVGQFWAFFPLRDQTTLSGILNAPWKTNDDRTTMLPGKFNEEFLQSAARLVTDCLPKLATKQDPGAVLDILPARGREARCWADSFVTEQTYRIACESPSLPDQSGVLTRPGRLKIHPEGVPKSVLEIWSTQPSRPRNWCHPSVETRERRSRADRLIEMSPAIGPKPIHMWLEALIDGKLPASYRSPLLVAAALVESLDSSDGKANVLLDGVKKARILIDENGHVLTPRPGAAFLPTTHRVESAAIRLIHPDLLSDEAVLAAVSTLGIQPVSPELELEATLATSRHRWTDSEWTRFWKLSRRIPPDEAATIICSSTSSSLPQENPEETQVRVLTVAGQFKHLAATLLPGPIVPSDGTRDGTVAIDLNFHRDDVELFKRLGASSIPMPTGGLNHGAVFRQYHFDCYQRYIAALPVTSSMPNADHMEFKQTSFAGPLEPLEALSEEGKAQFAETLLSTESARNPWSMRHRSVPKYPVVLFEPPTTWAVRRWGRVNSTLGPVTPAEAVGSSLAKWSSFLAVTKSPSVATALGLPESPEQLTADHWRKAFDRALMLSDEAELAAFYCFASIHAPFAPKVLRCRAGQVYTTLAPSKVTVVSQVNEYRALVEAEHPVLLLPTQTDELHLTSSWHCRPAEKTVRTELSQIPVGESVPLVDQFPGLRWCLKPEHTALQLVACTELRLETLTEQGKTSEPRDLWVQAGTVYWSTQVGEGEFLPLLLQELGITLSVEEQDAIIKQRTDQERRNRMVNVRTQTTNALRLLTALGVEAIKQRLPASLVKTVEAQHGLLSPEKVAELALVVYGVDVLREFREELAESGLQPPQRWAGSRHAKQFVAELGFGRPFAGFEEARREATLSVDGPCTLPPLHEYQIQTTHNIRKLLQADSKDRRGLLSLPTGAGKTRVAVQAIVESIGAGELTGPVLWVAQSDELCEQAVQTWREVWRSVGLSVPLQISRLWAHNEATDAEDSPHAVVATIQKLANCFSKPQYEWLKNAALLVIDEAHTSTTRSYTELLTWVGIDRRGARCPLIGLTATPFRGRSASETERLAARFGHTRLDPQMGKDPYKHLQSIGVLSQVEHRVLRGSRVTLTESELAHLTAFSKLPPSVDDRMASDTGRNQNLLKSIGELPKDWPILLFAASVEHAQTIAALLSLQGHRASPITADTEPGPRRAAIDEFKQGSLQILTNYGVLTQGFDAPATRAIYVARATFSPNLYQQMIGRGLRGPKNGGKESCLIVNVEDNFAAYGEELAFREFEHIWRRDE
jgi:superfamily II DNA or RNA helicase